jgi:hypothetical protein
VDAAVVAVAAASQESVALHRVQVMGEGRRRDPDRGRQMEPGRCAGAGLLW